MGRTKRRGRMPAKELIVVGLEPIPTVIHGWEVELVEPTLAPIIQEMAHERRTVKDEADAAE